MDGEDNGNPLTSRTSPSPEGTLPPLRRFKSFAPGYFETMGNRLVAGRSITWTEIYERRPVIVISETLAREYWRSPRERSASASAAVRSDPWREIVGVVGDERDDGLNQPATAIVYWPMLNDSYRAAHDGLRRAVEPRRHAGLPARAPAGGLVGQSESAAGRRADARRDSGALHGADIVCHGDAGALPRASRCCSASSGSTA